VRFHRRTADISDSLQIAGAINSVSQLLHASETFIKLFMHPLRVEENALTGHIMQQVVITGDNILQARRKLVNTRLYQEVVFYGTRESLDQEFVDTWKGDIGEV